MEALTEVQPIPQFRSHWLQELLGHINVPFLHGTLEMDTSRDGTWTSYWSRQERLYKALQGKWFLPKKYEINFWPTVKGSFKSINNRSLHASFFWLRRKLKNVKVSWADLEKTLANWRGGTTCKAQGRSERTGGTEHTRFFKSHFYLFHYYAFYFLCYSCYLFCLLIFIILLNWFLLILFSLEFTDFHSSVFIMPFILIWFYLFNYYAFCCTDLILSIYYACCFITFIYAFIMHFLLILLLYVLLRLLHLFYVLFYYAFCFI